MRKRLQITLSLLLVCSSIFAQPRWFWSQLPASDTTGSIAISLPDGNGIWSDSLRFYQGKLRIGIDTAATMADIRSNAVNLGSGTTGFLSKWLNDTLSNSIVSESGDSITIAGTAIVNNEVVVEESTSTKIYNYNTSTSTFTATNLDEFDFTSGASSVPGAFEMLFTSGNINDTRWIIEGKIKSHSGSVGQSSSFHVDFDIVSGTNVVAQQSVIITNKSGIDTITIWYNQVDTLGVFIGSTSDVHYRPHFMIDKITIINSTKENGKNIVNSLKTKLRTSTIPTNGDIITLSNTGVTASNLASYTEANNISADIFEGPNLGKGSQNGTLNLPGDMHYQGGAAGAIEINLKQISTVISYSGKVQLVVDVQLQDFSYSDPFQQGFRVYIDAYMLSGDWAAGSAKVVGKWQQSEIPVKLGTDASGNRCVWIMDTSYDPFRRFVTLRSVSYQSAPGGGNIDAIDEYWGENIEVGLTSSLHSVKYTLTTHLPYSEKVLSNSTDQEVFSSGTTAQRGIIQTGAFRVNTDSTRFEGSADGINWKSIAYKEDLETALTNNIGAGEIAVGNGSGIDGDPELLWNTDVLFVGDTTGIFTGLGSDNEYKLNSFENTAVFNGKLYARELNLSGSFAGIQFHNSDTGEGYEDVILQHETSNNKLFWQFEEGTNDWQFFVVDYDDETIDFYGKTRVNDDLLILDLTTTAARHTGVTGGISYDTDEDKPVFYDGTSYQLPIWESEEENGQTIASTNANGDITITHSLGSIPSVIVANAGVGGVPYIITWRVRSSTNITFRIYKNDGTGAATSTGPITIDYILKK